MRKLLIIALVLLSLGGCAEAQNKKQIEEAVRQYTTLLADGYRHLNMNPLAQAATEERATKAFYHMAALGEARIKMDARLRAIKFLEIKTGETLDGEKQAQVRTEEKWDYTYVNIDTAKPVFDNSVDYELTYTLIKKPDKWLVADIAVEKSKEKNDSSGFFERAKKENLPPGGNKKS